MTGEVRLDYIREMRVSWASCSWGVLIVAGLSALAAGVPGRRVDAFSARRIIEVSAGDDGLAMQRSLDRDVRLHPDDFIVFVTESEAHRFLNEHRDDAQRETNERMAARGVVGYWEGKMLVVLPLEWEKSSPFP